MNRRKRGKTNRDKERRPHASELFGAGRLELLIDGYNLLHVTRFQPRRRGDGELKRCREALLRLLADKLPESTFTRTTVVFDASAAPQHLDHELRWRHLSVVFAREDNSADDRIVSMVREHVLPTSLLVVSSDHRVQIAARRRKAIVVDSDVWFDALLAWCSAASSLPAAPEPENLRQDAWKDSDDPHNPPTTGHDQPAESPFPEGYLEDLEREFPGEV